MFPHERPTDELVDSKTYPLVENCAHEDTTLLALLALSHTQLEHRIYSAMLASGQESSAGSRLTARRLRDLTGIRSLSTVRRGLDGLMVKLSIDGHENGINKRDQPREYRVFSPTEVIARRKARGDMSLGSYARTAGDGNGRHSFTRAIARVAENSMLSRREAQVALCCVEGLTNADIGKRLDVSEQTVKFHLRNIFLKFGVKRRAELISRLLM